jgi:DNA/RNA endonuclease G (NUC1)
MKRLIVIICIPILLAFTGGDDTKKSKKNESEIEAPGKRYRPIILQKDYEHTKWGIEPSDLIFQFAAYTTSFDSDDDNNGDGMADLWGIPEWVAFEIKTKPEKMPKYKRPSPWLTHDSLYKIGKAPNDDTYKVSGVNEMKVVGGNNRFVRGHMCPKNAADRLGEDAGYNTHTILNAVPQLQWQNNGIWKFLEQDCTTWADKYNRIWVVAGPAFFKQNPSMSLGQAGEVPAAIPDAIYKIVIREDSTSKSGITTMAFLFPNIIASDEKNAADFLTTIEDIESVTKLKFLTTLKNSERKKELNRNKDLSASEKLAVYTAW